MAYRMVPSSLRTSALLMGGQDEWIVETSRINVSAAEVQQGYTEVGVSCGRGRGKMSTYTENGIQESEVRVRDLRYYSAARPSGARALVIRHSVVWGEALVKVYDGSVGKCVNGDKDRLVLRARGVQLVQWR